MKPVSDLDKKQLDNLIANHERHGRVDAPAYLEALSERARRDGRGLSFEKASVPW